MSSLIEMSVNRSTTCHSTAFANASFAVFGSHREQIIGIIAFHGKGHKRHQGLQCEWAALGDGVFHANRKPLSCMKKLLPKNPLFLAVIEEA